MKFIHLSDLHLGKHIYGFSMIEDQKKILDEIVKIIDTEKPNGVLIAGDVYDKSVPSIEAINLFDNFLEEMAKRNLQVFIISGNHDSTERLAFGYRLLKAKNINLSPVYDGKVCPISLNDDNGTVDVYMLPFIKPAHVRKCFGNEEIKSYNDALKLAVDKLNINPDNRNILLTHQFVTGAKCSKSEELCVGGCENVDVSIFEKFDYVALGHIHRAQNIGSEKVRYCGTPLKYSFSEVKDEKSITIVEINKKGSLNVRSVPLKPEHDMVEIKGKFNDLKKKEYYEETSYQEDYVHIILTDEDYISDGVRELTKIYKKLARLDYDNKRTDYKVEKNSIDEVETKSPIELFETFYNKQNGKPMSDKQKKFMENLIQDIWEDKQ